MKRFRRMGPFEWTALLCLIPIAAAAIYGLTVQLKTGRQSEIYTEQKLQVAQAMKDLQISQELDGRPATLSAVPQGRYQFLRVWEQPDKKCIAMLRPITFQVFPTRETIHTEFTITNSEALYLVEVERRKYTLERQTRLVEIYSDGGSNRIVPLVLAVGTNSHDVHFIVGAN